MFLVLAGVTGLTSQNQGNAFRVGRACEGNCVVLVTLAHGDSRHNQNIMAVQVAGLVCLRAGNVNAVLGALDNVQEQIRIRLLGRRQTAVALNVGHSAVNAPIVVLHIGPELDEILVVLGAASLVGLKGGGVNRVLMSTLFFNFFQKNFTGNLYTLYIPILYIPPVQMS